MTRVAVIGLGRVGYEFGLDKNRGPCASHFDCYLSMPNMNIALYDTDIKKLVDIATDVQKHVPFGSTVTGFTDINDLLKFKPEIVSICSPTNTHKEIALAVAECPSVQTIFLEKPIAQSLGEADEILFACNKNNVRLAVNYSRRWSKIYSQIKKELHTPTNMVGIHPGPLIRTGTHMIDLFNFFVLSSDCVESSEWDNVKVQAFGESQLAPYMKETEDLNINGYIDYGPAKAILLGNLQSVPQNTVVFELTAWTDSKDFKVTENGCRTETFSLSESKRYANLNEYKRVSVQENEPENLLLNAITELTKQLGAGRFTCTPESGYELKAKPVTCSGVDARRDLQVALALHYSATHDNKKFKLSEIPYDYTVRSY
jgi:hypothetical protein